jgi:sugar-specific transcriptional regulator TrmB
MKDMIRKLAVLGLSEYEAKVYLSLLREHPATAYEIGKSSGVPTSKVYEVIKKLLQKDMLTAMQEKGTTKRYAPLEPGEFLGRYKSSIDGVIGALREDLEGIKGDSELSHIWNISDYGFLIDKTARMIGGADRTVLLSLWGEELALLEESITGALKRGVKVAAVHFGRPEPRPWPIYHHPIEHTLYKEKGGRGLVVVADSEEVLMATVVKGNRVAGAWSTNRGFVTVAEDYIKHDIYIMKIVRRFDKALRETFGDRYVKLRDVFSDEEAQ